MPEIVTLSIPASQLRKDDRMLGLGSGSKVATVKFGTKWVEARDEAGKLLAKRASDEMIEVSRSQETAGEHEARMRSFRNEGLQRWIDHTDSDFESVAAKFVDALQYRADSFSYDLILVAQAQRQIRREIALIHENHPDSIDLVAAYELWADDARHEYAVSYRHSALSRSTSVMANVIEDVKRQEVFKVLDRNLYGGF